MKTNLNDDLNIYYSFEYYVYLTGKNYVFIPFVSESDLVVIYILFYIDIRPHSELFRMLILIFDVGQGSKSNRFVIVSSYTVQYILSKYIYYTLIVCQCVFFLRPQKIHCSCYFVCSRPFGNPAKILETLSLERLLINAIYLTVARLRPFGLHAKLRVAVSRSRVLYAYRLYYYTISL